VASGRASSSLAFGTIYKKEPITLISYGLLFFSSKEDEGETCRLLTTVGRNNFAPREYPLASTFDIGAQSALTAKKIIDKHQQVNMMEVSLPSTPLSRSIPVQTGQWASEDAHRSAIMMTHTWQWPITKVYTRHTSAN